MVPGPAANRCVSQGMGFKSSALRLGGNPAG